MIFGVRNVVWKMTVWLQEDTPGSIRAQAPENLRRKEAARTVAGIHNNMHAFKRRLAYTDALTNLLSEMVTVPLHEIVTLHFAKIARKLRHANGGF